MFASSGYFLNSLRKQYYSTFLHRMTEQMPFTYIAYIKANYGVNKAVKGVDKNVVLGHHGVGIFWNVADWKLER